MKKWLLRLYFVLLLSIFFLYLLNINFPIKIEAEKAPKCKIIKESEFKNVIFTNDINMKIIRDKSIIYCDGFQKAWNKLAEELKCSTLEVEGAPDYVSILNNNLKQSNPTIQEKMYYVAAGKDSGDVNTKINADLSKKYGITNPEMEIKNESDSVHLFSCFQNNVKFITPFLITGVSSFGYINYRTGYLFDSDYDRKYSDVKTFGINEWTAGNKILTINSMIRRLIYHKPFQLGRITKNDTSAFFMLIDTKSGDELYISTAPSPLTNSKLSSGYKYSLIDVCNGIISLLTDTENFLNSSESFYGPNGIGRNFIKETEISHRDTIKIPIINFDYIIYHDKLADKTINKKYKLCTPVQRIMVNTNSEEDYYYSNFLRSFSDNVQKKYPDQFITRNEFIMFAKRKTEAEPYLIIYIGNDELLTK